MESKVQNKKLIEQLFNEAMNGNNLALLDEVIAPGFINKGIPDSKPGPDGFRESIQQFKTGYPDMRVNVEQIIAEGDFVATRGYWTGTNRGEFMGVPATNKKVRVDYIDFWRVQNGKCVEGWVQMDNAGLFQQLGVTPELQHN